MKLSEFVKKYRKLNLLTQSELGKRLGINNVQVSKIESGRPISINTMRKLSDVMGIDPESIYNMYQEEISKEE